MEEFKIDSALAKKAAEQLRSGKSLFGKDGALAPMLERILNAALEGEMDALLSDSTHEEGNRRNGKMPKRVQTPYGEVNVDTPCDRDGSFHPEIVKKRETILAEGMADQIINMYAFGTSTREIMHTLKENLPPSFQQRLSVPSQTEYYRKSRTCAHVRWILCMLSAGSMPFIIR